VKRQGVGRLKDFARLQYGDALATDLRCPGEFPVFGSNGAIGSHDTCNTLAPAVIIGRKGSFGKVNWAEGGGFCIDTAFFVDSRHSGCDLRYLYYLLQDLELDASSKDVGVPGLDRDEAHRRFVELPSLEDQVIRRDKLDLYLGSIAKRIEAITNAISLLNELKMTLVAEAVTNTVDGNPAHLRKESDIPWVSCIPRHWSTKRVGDLFRLKKEKTQPGRKDVLSLTLNGVIERDIDVNRGLQPESYDTYQIVKKGDIVFKLIDLENYNTSRVGYVSGLYAKRRLGRAEAICDCPKLQNETPRHMPF